jgi:hypothetical protein
MSSSIHVYYDRKLLRNFGLFKSKQHVFGCYYDIFKKRIGRNTIFLTCTLRRSKIHFNFQPINFFFSFFFWVSTLFILGIYLSWVQLFFILRIYKFFYICNVSWVQLFFIYFKTLQVIRENRDDFNPFMCECC